MMGLLISLLIVAGGVAGGLALTFGAIKLGDWILSRQSLPSRRKRRDRHVVRSNRRAISTAQRRSSESSPPVSFDVTTPAAVLIATGVIG